MNEFFDIVEDDFDTKKKKFIEHMTFLKNMSVENQTFYKKYIEVQSYTNHINNASIVKAKLWMPEDLNDEDKTVKQIESISPRVLYVDRKSTRLNSSHIPLSRMPSSA